MEAMQLQPVRADLVYPSRMNRSLRYDAEVITPIEIMEAEVPQSGSGHKLPFIEANTKEVTIEHLKNDCVVPVFSKDNEITISHPNFIEAVWEAANRVFPNETIECPAIRVSHVIKGRTPEAIHKPVKDLLETDKTIYYERMMFCFEIPTIHEDIAGNRLNLTIGGVRAYNHENLYSRKGAEKFKVFIGFKNMVCCNMCVSTDGYKSELKVMSINDITEENGRLWIRKSRYKTNVMYHVPILKPAKEILDKYASLSHKEGKLLPVLSNQKMNAYLKEIAGIVGISKDLTTHLARHTFATTVTLANQVSIENVSKMLGHSSIRMTQHYARVLDASIEHEMLNVEKCYE